MVSQHILDDAVCTFAKGEEQGVHLLKELIRFAPDDERALEVKQQILDEEKHAKIFHTKLQGLDIDCDGLKDNLQSLYNFAQECVDQKDWTKCIAIQAVIEELAMAAFMHRYASFDSETQNILNEVIEDEKNHLAFALKELDQMKSPEQLETINTIHKKAIQLMVTASHGDQLTEEEKRESHEIMKKSYKLHKARLAKIGITLPVPPLELLKILT